MIHLAYFIDGPEAGKTMAVDRPEWRCVVPSSTASFAVHETMSSAMETLDVGVVIYREVGRNPRTGLRYFAVIEDSRENEVRRLREEIRRLKSKIEAAKDDLR